MHCSTIEGTQVLVRVTEGLVKSVIHYWFANGRSYVCFFQAVFSQILLKMHLS